MPTLSTGVVVLAAALSAGAPEAFEAVASFGPSPTTMSRPAETLVIPGVANTVGTHGVRWRSDLTLKNPNTEPVEARVFFLKSGVANDLASAGRKDYFLPAGESREIR